MNLSDLAPSAINGVTKALDSKPEQEEKTSFGGGVLRFFITLIWFLITFVVSLAALYGMAFATAGEFFGFEMDALATICIAACGIIALLTFIIPYLRKKGTTTRWLGIVALGDFLYWLYIWFTL